jgi:chemotaxis family two-component system sensor kinase Cph1
MACERDLAFIQHIQCRRSDFVFAVDGSGNVVSRSQNAPATLISQMLSPTKDVTGMSVQRYECDDLSVYECTRVVDHDCHDIVKRVSAMQQQMLACTTETQLFDTTCEVVGKFVKFDRAMVYLFDEEWNGRVVHELNSAHDSVEYMGLHFPASDIPRVARDLYFQNKVRVIFDVSKTEIPMVGSRVNMKQCMLRGVAPIHVEYMTNMGIKASISIALGIEKLEGLLVFHSYTDFTGIDTIACEVLKQTGCVFSHMQKRHQEVRDDATLRDAEMSMAPPSQNLTLMLPYMKALTASAARLLGLKCIMSKGCSDVPVAWYGSVVELPNYEEDGEYVHDCMRITVIRKGFNVLLLVRHAVEADIKWAGDPHTKLTGSIHPRNSFAVYIESKKSCPVQWTPLQYRILDRLRSCIYEAWSAREVKLLRSDLESVETNAIKKYGLLSGVCHEVRNALACVLSPLDAYKEHCYIDPDVLEGGFQAVNHATRLLTDVMTVKAVYSDEITIVPEAVWFKKFFVCLAVIDKRVMIESTRCDSETGMIDSTRLRQIVLNLVTNALKFSDKEIFIKWCVTWCVAQDSHYDLSTYSTSTAAAGTDIEGLHLYVSITDVGCGMHPDFINNMLFRAFVQEGRLNHDKGVGLGMSIAKNLAVRMGGSLEAGSTLGGGSRFVMRLPLQLCITQPQQGYLSDIVWVVDDSNVSRKTVCRFIPPGFKVTQFTCAEDALRRLQIETPAVVISDFHMVANGLTGLQLLTEVAKKAPARLVLCTGSNDDPSISSMCYKAGIRLLAKPLRKGDVAACFEA